MRIYEESLGRLKTDRVDLLHMHGLGNADDLAAIEAPDGALKAMYKLREEKATRFIGVTCHADPTVLKTCLERHDLDCTQIALNAGLVGSVRPQTVSRGAPSFEKVAMPVALKKKMGLTAMKALAQERLLSEASAAELVRYAMSLPVASAVVGMPKMEHIEEEIQLAKNFAQMSQPEMQKLNERISAVKKAEIDEFFRDHADACDECGMEIA
jgi:predicted aldo/keto reductase-like oxidoreductase